MTGNKANPVRSARGASDRSAFFYRPRRPLWVRPGARRKARRQRLHGALVALAVVAGVALLLLWARVSGVVIRPEREVPCDAVFYYQGYAGWKDDRLGDSEKTMGEYGDGACCLASLMAMQHIAAPFEGAVNPGTLNAWLGANGAYDEDGNLKWASAAALLGLDLTEQRANGGSASLLERLIQQEVYAVVQVDSPGLGRRHDVLLVGSNHGEFTIVDPADPSKTLNTLGRYKNKIYFMRYLKAPGSETT